MASREMKRNTNTKKTTTKKETVKPTVSEDVAVTEKATVAKKEFDQSDGILCHSVIQGGLYFDGTKTGILYTFSDYGDYTEIEYRDLAAAVRTKSEYIFNPYFVIDDEGFIAEFPAVEKFYSEKFTTKDLREILYLDIPDMIAEIERLPQTAVESLKNIASTQIANGNIDSIRKIKALDEIFDTDLSLISELFSED